MKNQSLIRNSQKRMRDLLQLLSTVWQDENRMKAAANALAQKAISPKSLVNGAFTK